MSPAQLVVFYLSEHQYALHLSKVSRIIRSVEVTPLPKGPDIVLGIINMQGEIIPVFNLKRRFGLEERDLDPADQFIIANTTRWTVALAVDMVMGLIARPEKEILPPEAVLSDLKYVEGIIKLDDGIVLIHDLEKFLSLSEVKQLGGALGANRDGAGTI